MLQWKLVLNAYLRKKLPNYNSLKKFRRDLIKVYQVLQCCSAAVLQWKLVLNAYLRKKVPNYNSKKKFRRDLIKLKFCCSNRSKLGPKPLCLLTAFVGRMVARLPRLTKLALGSICTRRPQRRMMVKGTRPQTVMTVKGPATRPPTNA